MESIHSEQRVGLPLTVFISVAIRFYFSGNSKSIFTTEYSVIFTILSNALRMRRSDSIVPTTEYFTTRLAYVWSYYNRCLFEETLTLLFDNLHKTFKIVKSRFKFRRKISMTNVFSFSAVQNELWPEEWFTEWRHLKWPLLDWPHFTPCSSSVPGSFKPTGHCTWDSV